MAPAVCATDDRLVHLEEQCFTGDFEDVDDNRFYKNKIKLWGIEALWDFIQGIGFVVFDHRNGQTTIRF